jgi:hypothetical protein
MKIKLDEHLGQRGAEIFRSAGHDVETVASEGLSGATDRALIDVCRRHAGSGFQQPAGVQAFGLCRYCGDEATAPRDGHRFVGRLRGPGQRAADCTA